MRILITAKILLLTMLASCAAGNKVVEEKVPDFTPSQACIEVLRSNCNATQQELLDELLKKLGIYGIGKQLKRYPGEPPAFQALQKDEIGLINWTKALSDGVIKPHGTLEGKKEKPYEGLLENLIFMQVEVHIMADVVFPHGMHTDLLNCNSCHPEPFKKVKSGNKIKMKQIFAGKWCGKCHGTVAFPTEPYASCRRCHVFPKKPL